MKNILTIAIICGSAYMAFSQNFGIDQSTPLTKLHVNYTSSGVLTGTGAYGGLHLEQVAGNDGFVGITTDATSTGTQGGILFQGSGAYGTKIHFMTSSSYAAGMSNRMTLDHLGNLGIGTTAPGAKLEVIGNVSVPGNLGYGIYSWANNDANWRIGMSNVLATVGFSRVLATSHVQYVTFASGAGQGFAVGDASSDLSAFEVTGSGSSYAAYFRGTIRSEPLAGTANRAVYASSNGTLIASPNFTYVVDRTLRTHSATDGVYTMSNSTGDLAVSVGDVISINTSFKFAFTGGSGNDDVFFILNITGCATTTQQDSYYHQNFDNDRNELQPMALQWVYVSPCNGNLQFNMRVNHTANADDAASTADVVIVATRY